MYRVRKKLNEAFKRRLAIGIEVRQCGAGGGQGVGWRRHVVQAAAGVHVWSPAAHLLRVRNTSMFSLVLLPRVMALSSPHLLLAPMRPCAAAGALAATLPAAFADAACMRAGGVRCACGVCLRDCEEAYDTLTARPPSRAHQLGSCTERMLALKDPIRRMVWCSPPPCLSQELLGCRPLRTAAPQPTCGPHLRAGIGPAPRREDLRLNLHVSLAYCVL